MPLNIETEEKYRKFCIARYNNVFLFQLLTQNWQIFKMEIFFATKTPNVIKILWKVLAKLRAWLNFALLKTLLSKFFISPNHCGPHWPSRGRSPPPPFPEYAANVRSLWYRFHLVWWFYITLALFWLFSLLPDSCSGLPWNLRTTLYNVEDELLIVTGRREKQLDAFSEWLFYFFYRGENKCWIKWWFVVFSEVVKSAFPFSYLS